MSKSSSALLAMSLIFGLSFFTLAAATPPVDKPNALGITRDVLTIFYPEIFGSGRYVNISTGQPVDNESWDKIFDFQFKVTRFGPGVSWSPTYDAKTDKLFPTPENTIFLEGSSWIGYRGEIIRFLVDGDLAHSKQNEMFRNLVEAHPEWPEDQAINALKEAGARYGPAEKQPFIHSLHFEKADKVLGRLTIKLVQFDGLSADHVGNFASLLWIVHVEGQLPDGTHHTYGLTFEPFEGKLTGLSQIMDRD